MPLMRSSDRASASWNSKPNWHVLPMRERPSEPLEIALVNNMPDAALEDTENQFLGLLSEAAGELTIRVDLVSLPEISRGERAQEYMRGRYSDFRDLAARTIDALIITGTEPKQRDLRKEAYWGSLVDLLDWAASNTASTLLSCLAAHAGVLSSDGVERHLLKEKRFGIFEEERASYHPLLAGAPDKIRIPHSRWNELREPDLVAAGYTILTRSEEAGVGLFVKQSEKSLFVCAQGHPEYGVETLLKEYRRDVRRFLRKERETYPSMPSGYFNPSVTQSLAQFRERALSESNESVLAAFPDSLILPALQNGWHGVGLRFYRNWLSYLAMRKAASSTDSRLGQIERQ